MTAPVLRPSPRVPYEAEEEVLDVPEVRGSMVLCNCVEDGDDLATADPKCTRCKGKGEMRDGDAAS